MSEESNRIKFFEETFTPRKRGLKFAIETLPISFRKVDAIQKKKTRKEIIERLNKDFTKERLKRFFSGELTVELNFRFNRRYSNTDVDNIAKFTLDCMEKLAYQKDSQIKELIVRKFKCPERFKGYIGVRISKCNE